MVVPLIGTAGFLGGTLGSAALGAGGSILGGLMSGGGASAQNAANMAMNAQNIALQERMNYENLGHQDRANALNMQMQYDINSANAAAQRSINTDNMYMQRETNQWNAEQVQKQMDFQERMSNTSYQRAMADMEKAGLNPILAYQQGGASSMSGGAAVGQAPKSVAPVGQAARVEAFQGKAPQNTFPAINTQADLGKAIGTAVTSAMESARSFQNWELTRQQTDLTREQAASQIQDTARKIEETFKTREEVDQVKEYTKILKSQGVVAAIEALDAGKWGSKLTPDGRERITRTIGHIMAAMYPQMKDAIEKATGISLPPLPPQ